MRCPFCQFDNDRVVDSRVNSDGRAIRRRRECVECHKRFTTYERIEIAPRMVVKKNSGREFYSRTKILIGLSRACKNCDIAREQLEAVVDKIENEVFAACDGDVETRVIGEKVMCYLRELNEVGYVRFLSVYQAYKGAEDFLHAVERMVPADGGPEVVARSGKAWSGKKKAGTVSRG